MRKIALVLAALLASVCSASADFVFTSGSGNTAFDFTCFTTKHCFASVPINSAGTEIGTSANPMIVSGIGVANPTAFGSQTGSPVMGFAETTPTALSTNNLGFVSLVPTNRAMRVDVASIAGTAAAVDPCAVVAKTYTPISITTATTTRIVSPSASNKTYICNLFITSAAADNVGIVEGTGGTCGSGTAGVIGGTTAANGPNFSANGGFAIGNGGATVAKTAGTNVDLCLITSAATPLAGVIGWVQTP